MINDGDDDVDTGKWEELTEAEKSGDSREEG